jgi:hypothetical protein
MENVKEIIPPINNYHNIILRISNQINELFDDSFISDSFKSEIAKSKTNKLLLNNHLIYTNDSIILFNLVEIKSFNDDTIIYIKDGIINNNNYELILRVMKYYDELKLLFNQYYYIVNVLMNNYDTTISLKIVNTIYRTVLKSYDRDNVFLLPYKSKIKKLVDNDKTIENLYNKFEYIIVFKRKVNNYIEYSIQRVLSSEKSITKNIDNLNYLEKEILLNGSIMVNSFEEFLKNLYFYGKI